MYTELKRSARKVEGVDLVPVLVRLVEQTHADAEAIRLQTGALPAVDAYVHLKMDFIDEVVLLQRALK